MSKKNYKPVLADEVNDSIGRIAIVDVRPSSYYAEGHIPTSINVPFDEIAEKDGDLDANVVEAFQEAGIGPDDEFIVACQVGYHSKLAADALHDAGYENVLYYPGSFEDWVLDPDHEVDK